MKVGTRHLFSYLWQVPWVFSFYFIEKYIALWISGTSPVDTEHVFFCEPKCFYMEISLHQSEPTEVLKIWAGGNQQYVICTRYFDLTGFASNSSKIREGIALIQSSPLLGNLSARTGFSLVNLGSLSSKENEFKISISFRQGPPLKNQVHLLILKKLKGWRYLKEILILNSFSFENKGPRFTRLKPVLALRLLCKGLFYKRAMVV